MSPNHSLPELLLSYLDYFLLSYMVFLLDIYIVSAIFTFVLTVIAFKVRSYCETLELVRVLVERYKYIYRYCIYCTFCGILFTPYFLTIIDSVVLH